MTHTPPPTQDDLAAGRICIGERRRHWWLTIDVFDVPHGFAVLRQCRLCGRWRLEGRWR